MKIKDLPKDTRFGWRKDKYDGRDYKHKARIVHLPDSVDLSQYLPAVRNQGGVGSCTGFGVGSNITAWAKKLGVYTEWFSPWWIYNGARFLEGTLLYDNGAYPRDCFEWLLKKGCLLEHRWPYVDGTSRLDKTSPPSKFNNDAAEYPLFEYVRVTGGSSGIMDALVQGHPVSIGTPWYEDWMSTDSKGNLPVIKSGYGAVGGHETLLYGYDKPNNIFLGMNSWGKGWGKVGFYRMQMDVFDGIFQEDGGYDAHICCVKWGAQPEPTPTPAIEQAFNILRGSLVLQTA